MIPFATVRAADRIRIQGLIAAQPSAARLRRPGGTNLEFAARLSEPRKAREMKQGGFDSGISSEALIALPTGSPKPEPAKEFLDFVDLDGVFRAATILTCTPLRGSDCYLLGLVARNSAPPGVAPVVAGTA